jgi:AcrR family transcriptional regulator
MPKQVDHRERRHHIAAALARVARERGLQGVTFREVAAEAGVSVSLVQHYFGDKQRLLIDALDIQSARIAERIGRRLEAVGSETGPLGRIRVVAETFLPTDAESREAMLLYLGFAGAAVTDASLRHTDAFRNGRGLLDFLATELRTAAATGEAAEGIDPEPQALAILSLVLGLSLAVLLEQATPREATTALDAHLSLLELPPAA